MKTCKQNRNDKQKYSNLIGLSNGQTNKRGFWLARRMLGWTSILKVIFQTFGQQKLEKVLKRAHFRMPDWSLNASEGINKFRAAYPIQKRYQIVADCSTSGSFVISARENCVCCNTAWAIYKKFIATGDCQAGARGRPASKTQPFIAACLEAIFFVNPFLYLGEMQGRLRADLNFLPHEVPSVPVICQTLHDLNLTKHKST